MTVKQFDRAKEIEKEIKDLVSHLKEIENVERYNYHKLRLTGDGSGVNLISDLLPIEHGYFNQLYKNRVKSRIESLEKEFRNL